LKKILIVVNNMNVGGIQKALLEFLKALSDRNDLSVDLFCANKVGEFLDRIPEKINVLDENKWAEVSEKGLSACKQLGFKYFLFRYFASLWSRFFGKAFPAKILCSRIGSLGEYDVAISYSQPINDRAFCTLTNEIALYCSSAKKKATFVHCDFASYGGNTKTNRDLYKKFDAIAAVSDSVGNRIKDCIPEIADKVKTCYNFCDVDEIIKLSSENSVEYKKPTVVSVARLSKEKGLLRTLSAVTKLKGEGLDFEWHIVGDGPERVALEEAIKANFAESFVILEGQQLNPYRYLKNADYLLLPSFHEAAPVVFDEAIALGVPILSTETLSARELVVERGAGMICENSEDGIYNMLLQALKEKCTVNSGDCLSGKIRMEQFDALCEI